jgi:hypothetical protein
MKPKPLSLFSRPLMLVAVILQVLSVHAQPRPEQGDLPERREIHRTFRLAHGANVEVSMIAGPVEIETTNDDTAEVNVIESAKTRADLDCYKTVVEQTSTRLIIRHEQSCSNVRDYQRVKLILPRSVNPSLENIAGFVHVGAIDGMLRLNSIAGEVTLTQVQAAEISSLAKGLTIGLAQPSNQGLRISSVIGGVDLNVFPGVNANLVISSLMGQIRNEASDISVTEMQPGYRIVIGSGGPAISVSSIMGEIKIHH